MRLATVEKLSASIAIEPRQKPKRRRNETTKKRDDHAPPVSIPVDIFRAASAIRGRRGGESMSLAMRTANAGNATDAQVATVRRRSRIALRCVLAAAVLAAYPVFVLGQVYAVTLRSDLPGGRHGPKDAYRHSLASAIVAYTGSPRWVAWVTAVMEPTDNASGHARDTVRSASHAMDAHNNRLGARIGAQAESWHQMHAAVRAAVEAGGVQVDDENRITWLPPEKWRERLY
jgi:hypothetical protein